MNSFILATRRLISHANQGLTLALRTRPQTASILSIERYSLPPISTNYAPLMTSVKYNILQNVKHIQVQPQRTRVYQSWNSSKPKTVESVPERFKRLGNGLWIRTRAGRHKHLWKKSRTCRRRLQTHVICTKRQTWLLERMVNSYWQRHRHYPNDPYAPYHKRSNFSRDKIYNKTPFYP